MVCSDCLYKIEVASELKKNCEDSHQKILSHLEENQNVTNLDPLTDSSYFENDDMKQEKVKESIEALENCLDSNLELETEYLENDSKSIKLEMLKESISIENTEDLIVTSEGEDCEDEIDDTEKTELSTQEKEPIQYMCEIPGCLENKFDKNYKLIKHRIEVHNDPRPHKCPICNKGFKGSNVKAKHMVTHSTDKNFACELCPKRFSVKNYLRLHQRVHVSLKDFIIENQLILDVLLSLSDWRETVSCDFFTYNRSP